MSILLQRKKSYLGALIAFVIALSGFQTPAFAVAPTHGAFSPISATWGVGAISIAPPTSNSLGAWSYTSSNVNTAQILGNIATIKNVGTTTITAIQAANGIYDAKSISTTLTVLPAIPTLGNFASITLGVDAAPITLTAPTSTSAGTWSFTTSNSAIASISGSIFTPRAIGTVTLTAIQSANFNWAATSRATTVTITGGSPTTGPFADLNLILGSVANVALVPPTSNSLGAWTFTSSNTAVATITGNILRPLKIGTSTITATQAASGKYGSLSKTMTLTVQGGPPTLGEFKNVTASLQPFASNQLALIAPISNSAGAWSFTTSNSQIVSVNGGIATLLNKGTVTITATQAAAGDFGASSPVTMELTVTGANPVIGSWENVTKNISEGRFIISPPSSSSGGKWSFKSLDPTIAEVDGTEVLLKGVGQAVIKGTQAADWNWEAGESQLTLTISGTDPTLGQWVLLEAGIGDEPIAIKPPTSNSPGVWSFASSDNSVARIENEKLVPVAVGRVTITAIQAISGNFGASKPVTTTLTVKPRATHAAMTDINLRYNSTPIDLTPPTSNSKGEWSFSIENPEIAKIEGRKLSVLGVGTTKIFASQSSDENFAPTITTLSIRVTQSSPELSWQTFVIKAGSKTESFRKPVTNSDGVFIFKSSNPNIADFVNGELVGKKSGTAIITAAQQSSKNFSSGVVATSIVVKPSVSVKLKGRVLRVSVVGASAKVTINGSKAKVGKNKVGPGTRKVVVTSGGERIFNKTFKVP